MTEQKHDHIFLHHWDGNVSSWGKDRITSSDVEYIRKELHDQQIAAKDAENTELKVQLLNRSVSNMEASANFALTELQQQLSTLKAELKCIGEAIDDPRTDLTMTMSEIIIELKQQLAAALAAIKVKDDIILEVLECESTTRPPVRLREALAIQPDDSALKDKAMTTYEQPKDWIERHLVEDPGGLLACEPSRLDTLNEELRLARQAIEAFQMTKERRMDNSEWPNWLHLAWNTNRNELGSLQRVDMDATLPDDLEIVTLEGKHLVGWGDYIIQGVKGELYPCKPDIFHMTYEEVKP